MSKISRREFLGKSAMGIGSAFAVSQIPFDPDSDTTYKPKKMPVGFQVWTIKDQLVKDFPGTLKKMAGLGFQTVEMCSPPGYESSGFGPLMKLTAKEMKKIISDAGLACTSCHYGMSELRNNLDERVAFALEIGQKQMILSSFGLRQTATLSDWLKAADELNEIGMKAKKGGIQIGFHNHHGEFAQLEGKLIYEELMKEFDPEYVKMQFQVAVISIGFKAADYFKKYPGRFISAHLADYSPEKKASVALGQGIVDWKEFYANLKTGGVKNIFIEMNEDTFKDSISYLKGL
jgi:sugar phosphate isomerase/epimerase